MSIYAYEVFDTAVKTGSFLRAAEQLHLSPSAVSHSIARLEESFHTKLFNRNHNQIELTAAGQYLLPYVRDVLRSENRLRQESNYLYGEALGNVRIGTPNSVCRTWIPELVRSFQKRYPGINVEIAEGTYDYLLDWVRLQSVDIAFLPSEIIPESRLTLLHRDPILCVTPYDFVPLHGDHVCDEDLQTNRFIRFTGKNDAETERFLVSNKISLDYGLRVDDAFSLVTLVEQGFGLGILTEMTARGIEKKVRYYPVEPESFRTLGLLEIDPEFETRAVQLFRDHTLSYLTEIGEAELLEQA